MAAWLEREEVLRRLGAECTALEDRAGLTAVMERAREGQFMPDPNASSEEYFASEHDAVRRKTRDAYFSIDDINLRRSLIAAERQVRQELRKNSEAELDEAIKALGVAEAEAKRSHSPQLFLFVAGGVVAGAIGFGALGLLLGGVAGYFFGKWHVQEKTSNSKDEIRSLADEVTTAKDDLREMSQRPDFFTSREEESGERDNSFDRESAYERLFDKGHRN